MKKTITFLLAAFALLTSGAITAFGQNNYEKVTSAPSDWTGEYLLVFENSSTSAYCWTGVDAGNCYTELTINGNTITATDPITISVEAMTGGYSILVNGGTNDGKFIYGQSGSNTIKFGTTAVLNTFEVETDGIKITSNTSVMRFNSASNQLRFRYFKSSSYSSQQPVQLYKKSTGGGSTPTINANNVNIAYDATSGSIPYTISNPTSATLSATTTADWVSNIAVTSSAVTFNTTANTATTERTATFTLTYTGASDKTVTVTQAPAPVVYTTISDLFAAATSTATDVTVTFGNWVVTGVSTNGKNVFVTDGTNGFMIYSSTSMSSTYAAGNILSGTIDCKLKLNQGYAQLTNVSGLTINTGGSVGFSTIDMANLAGVNTGALVHYDSLTCSVSSGKYYLTDGTTTLQVYNSLYSFGSTLEDGKIYNISGVYQQYNTTKEVLPRSAADIVEVVAATPELTVTPATLTGFTYTETNGPSTAQSISVSGSDLTADVTVTAPTNFEVCETENGTYSSSMTITASGTLAATNVYVRLKAGLTENNYSGDLTVSSMGATSQTVALSGSVTTAPVVTSYTFNKVNNHKVVAGRSYLIVDVTTSKALTSLNGASSAPSAVAVDIVADSIVTGDTALMWTFEAATNGYIIHPNGDANNWLYSTTSNNGVRVGTGSNNVWAVNITDTLKPNYHGFVNTALTRYLGVYSNNDWRTYTTIHNNIANTKIELFILGDVPASEPVLTASATQLSGFTYVHGSGPSEAQHFDLYGSDLADTVHVVAPTNFEICLTSNGTYADQIDLITTAGVLDSTTVYVRLVANLDVNNYSGTLTATCGSVSVNVALSGSVTSMPVVATPTFSLDGGSFLSAQTVSISCTTEGATIYYTTNGTDPTTSSTVYSSPLNITTTTTLKAMAAKAGYQNSAIDSVTYSILTPMDIVNARSLANNEFACVEGIVVFVDGRNLHIQDATAGIDLYLNNNTVPSGLAVGDNVRAYGKKTVYKGLVELTNINGGDENAFVILSSGNTLPLAETTIADINADFADTNIMQSTRVKIENAIIGEINPSGTTVITQSGESLNVYHIPAVSGMTQGDYVTITGVIGCYNTPQLLVASADDIEYTHRPNIVATPSSLSGMTYDYDDGGPSNIVSFMLSGSYLHGRVSVYPSEHFEVSTFPEELFTPEDPAIVSASSGHFHDIAIYVRMVDSLAAGTYTEQLTLASVDMDTVYVDVTGTVTGGPQPTPPTPTPGGSGDYVRISSLSQLVNGSQVIIASRYNSTTNAYEAAANTLTSGKMGVTPFVSTTNSSNEEILPAAIVDTDTSYYWTVGFDGSNYTLTNYHGDTISYNSGTNFNFTGNKTAWNISAGTSDTITLVPEYTGFTIINVDTDTRAFALRYNTEQNFNVFGAYSTSNMTNAQASQYNYFLDLFMKTEGSGTLVVATPTFSPEAGTYTEAQTVTISCATDSVSIHYTLDGTEPDSTSLVYSGPLTINQTTTVKAIAMRVGYENSAVATAVYTIQTDPVINATPLALNGFTYVIDNGPSAEQSFSVSATNLTADLTLTEATDFEISTASGENYSAQNTITLTPVNGTVEATTIYVRMKAGLAVGAYEDENIVIASTGATTVNVVCDGEVTTEPQPGSGNYVRIGVLSDLANGDKVILASRYNETANAYLAAANTLTSGKLVTTAFNSTMDGTDEIIPEAITGNENEFYWTVGVTSDGYTFTNADGSMIGYGNSGANFVIGGDKTAWNISTATAEDGALVPNYTGFNIVNVVTDSRAFALRVTETESVVKAYSTSNMNNGEYNFYLDIFRQGEGGTPIIPTVATPTFSPAAGTYYETQTVTISCTTEGATIYYSTESETGAWVEYEGPITVAESMTIWAYAEKEDYNNSAVASAEYVINADLTIIFNQDWEGDWNGWTQVSVAGDSIWRINETSGNHYAYINAYQDVANEDWLISPAFDLDSYDDVVLTFRTARKYTGPDIEVFFSNNYNGSTPGTATWQPLTCTLSTGNNWNWTESGPISLDDFDGSNCYIAYKYTSTDEQAAGWEVDDIMLTSGSVSTEPYLIASPNSLSGFTHIVEQGPSEVQTFTLSGGNFLELPGGGYGSVSLSLDDLTGSFEMSLDGEEYTSNSLYIELDETLTLEPTTVYVRLWGEEIGQYTGSIYIEEPSGVSVTVALSGEVLSADQPNAYIIMPMYIQGNNSSNNNRVPVAMSVLFTNLEPNTTYRYVNQFVDINDGPETAGAGNVIYASEDGFYRSTSPSLSTEGAYGVFTTNESGYAIMWCINEPTANARFTPGNNVFLRIRINDGNDGTSVDRIFTSEDYATVINFGTGRDEYQGTAFIAKSEEAPMGFAVMYANVNDDQPIYATCIETTGVDYSSINQYADFYKDEVAGKDGWFGGILPNDNEIGINTIEIIGMDGSFINSYDTENGFWQPEGNTINPNGGLDTPVFIDLTYDGVDDNTEANVTVWSANHEFFIENGDDCHYTMTVFNMFGQSVMQRQINAGSSQRIGHNLSTGVYIINLENSHNRVATKVIVW